jgi:hypothetical protein
MGLLFLSQKKHTAPHNSTPAQIAQKKIDVMYISLFEAVGAG